MKNLVLFLLCAAVVVYFFVFKKSDSLAEKSAPAPAPAAQFSSASPSPPAPTPTNFLKRPIDRARDVRDLASKRAADMP